MIATAEKAALRFHPVSAPDYLPVANLQELQLDRLQATLRRAYDNVEFTTVRLTSSAQRRTPYSAEGCRKIWLAAI